MNKNKIFFEFSWKVKKIDFKTKIYFSLSLFNISEGGGFEKKKKNVWVVITDKKILKFCVKAPQLNNVCFNWND